MQRFYIFIRAAPGKARALGIAIARLKNPHVREISSIAGKWDLLLRIEIDNRRDVSNDVVERLFTLDHIERTKTVLAYQVFDPDDYVLDDDFD